MNPERSTGFLDTLKASACIHCGLCLASCPTYVETGDENLSPRGRIYLMRAMDKGVIPTTQKSARAIDSCLGCRACEAVCPSGVHYGQLLEETREHLNRSVQRGWKETLLTKVFVEGILAHPERMEIALTPARWIKQAGLERFVPAALREPLSFVDKTRPNEQSLPALSHTTRAPKLGTVALVAGCVMDVMFRETHRSTIRLLLAAGYDVVVPQGQGCCGALFSHNGNMAEARRCAIKNLAAFNVSNLEAVVINAAGCGSTLKDYGPLLAQDPQWAPSARAFSIKTRDLSEMLEPESIDWRPSRFRKVTYQDACHLAHAQRITLAPRNLVKRVAGDAYVEMPESDLCCGSAGSYNLTQPEMAGRLRRRKTGNILSTNTEVVVTSNPGCLLQMRAGLQAAKNSTTQVLHIADFLAAHLPVETGI